jgi:hypothetical protein
VVAHDAGGAEILSSLLRRAAGPADIRLALAGPACAVFARKLGPRPLHTPAQALQGAATLLCGSGWMGDFEWQALALARRLGVPSIAYLDHWINYPERFVRGGRRCLPDALWVGDEEALAIARRQLPELPATLVPNPYFAELQASLAARRANAPGSGAGGVRVLYVCEPVREPAQRQYGDPRHHGYTEEEALAYALAQLPAVLGPLGPLVLRPHPSEAPDKYDAQLAASPQPTRRGGQRPLLDEVAESDVVVGCNSMAMVVGLLAGKRVFSAIPPGGAPCVLPQRRIEMLRDALAAQASPA